VSVSRSFCNAQTLPTPKVAQAATVILTTLSQKFKEKVKVAPIVVIQLLSVDSSLAVLAKEAQNVWPKQHASR